MNKIVGSKAKGYFYVDQGGVRVTSREIQQAVAFVKKYSSAKLSRKISLRRKTGLCRKTDSCRKISLCRETDL